MPMVFFTVQIMFIADLYSSSRNICHKCLTANGHIQAIKHTTNKFIAKGFVLDAVEAVGMPSSIVGCVMPNSLSLLNCLIWSQLEMGWLFYCMLPVPLFNLSEWM
jgi:hypothetical protein